MTDPREALSRLTRWRDGDGPLISSDVLSLLSLVEKQQEALKDAAAAFLRGEP